MRPLPLPPFDEFTDAVPTSVVAGPDGAYYVSELTGVPFVDGRANIYRVVPGAVPRTFLTTDACLIGFKMIIDMAFDHDGSLLVLQYATGAVQAPGGGVLIRVIPDKNESDICAQYQAGTRTTVLAGLTQPTSGLTACFTFRTGESPREVARFSVSSLDRSARSSATVIRGWCRGTSSRSGSSHRNSGG